jgi:Fe-S cluster biogenesis protein NfuA
MIEIGELLDRLEQSMAHLDTLDDATRAQVFALLDGVDLVHRYALHRLTEQVGTEALGRARAAEPFVAWLAEVYGLGTDECESAVAAIEQVRPLLHSHDGDVEVLAASGGVVRVRLTGACQGCTASSITLQHGIEEALREHLPGFVVLEVEPDDAPPHPPPGAPLDLTDLPIGRTLPIHPA